MPDLTTLETDAATEAAKVRAELTTELSVLESGFTTEIAKLRAEMNSPHGHMVFGVLLFAAGMAADAILHLLH